MSHDHVDKSVRWIFSNYAAQDKDSGKLHCGTVSRFVMAVVTEHYRVNMIYDPELRNWIRELPLRDWPACAN